MLLSSFRRVLEPEPEAVERAGSELVEQIHPVPVTQTSSQGLQEPVQQAAAGQLAETELAADVVSAAEPQVVAVTEQSVVAEVSAAAMVAVVALAVAAATAVAQAVVVAAAAAAMVAVVEAAESVKFAELAEKRSAGPDEQPAPAASKSGCRTVCSVNRKGVGTNTTSNLLSIHHRVEDRLVRPEQPLRMS